MRADNEFLIGEAGRHLANSAHIVLEEPPQIAEALWRSLRGVAGVKLHPPVDGFVERPPKMVGRAEARGEQNEFAVLAQDLLLPCFPGFLEAGMEEIEARIAGDVVAADLFQNTFQVLLLSFAPQEQIVDI